MTYAVVKMVEAVFIAHEVILGYVELCCDGSRRIE